MMSRGFLRLSGLVRTVARTLSLKNQKIPTSLSRAPDFQHIQEAWALTIEKEQVSIASIFAKSWCEKKTFLDDRVIMEGRRINETVPIIP